jgi:uncharacterized protein YxeA
MKKILYIIFGMLLFSSCNIKDPVYTIKISSETDYVKIDGQRYYKIELEGHQYYFRKFSTYSETGSDLVHNPNCSCNKKEDDNKSF